MSHFELTPPEPKRDWRLEKHRGKSELVSTMTKLREARLSPTAQVIHTAQFLIFLGLPTRPTPDRTITQSTRLGDGSQIKVTFAAMHEGIKLPFGADSTLLHWMINKAIRAGSPFVNWESGMEYIHFAGLTKSGRTMQQLRERYQRIAGLSISIQRKDSQAVESFHIPVIRASRLPSSIIKNLMLDGSKNKSSVVPIAQHQKENERFGFQFDQGFFDDFISHNVPMLKDLLLLASEMPQLQQYIGFLGYRSYAAASASVIPWNQLRQQLWHTDSNESRIRQRFKETIQALRIAWPELQAEALPRGLYIAPPANGIQFIAHLPRPTKQVDPTNSLRTVRLIG